MALVAVIPTYAAGAELRVERLARQLATFCDRVDIVANSQVIFERLWPRSIGRGVHVVSHGRNVGFGGAVNRVPVTPDDYLLIVNDDVLLDDVDLPLLQQKLSRLHHNEADTVSLVGSSSGRVRLAPSSIGALFRVMGMWAIARHWNQRIRGIEQLEFYFVLVSGAVFQDLGGFDEEHYPLYFEDADFVLRLTGAGYRAVVAEAPIRHSGSLTSSGRPEVVSLQSLGAYSYLRQHHRWNAHAASALIRIANILGIPLELLRTRAGTVTERWRIARQPMFRVSAQLPPYTCNE